MRPYANAWRSGPDHHDKWLSTTLIIELNHARGVYAGQSVCGDSSTVLQSYCPHDLDMEKWGRILFLGHMYNVYTRTCI